MPTFIKTGFWERSKNKFKGWLNLDDVITSVALPIVSPPVTITDSSSITISSANNVLTSDEAAITFAINYDGNDIVLEVILNAVTATYTFPATALCVSEGIETGNNTLVLTGVSGDTYIICIKKIGAQYYVVAKNFGQ